MKIPKTHPRYESLLKREKIVEAYRNKIVVEEGLIAHGRGETFDYLIGEKTEDFAMDAINACAASLFLAKKPIISVNGNMAALCPENLIELNKTFNAKIEVNLFYRTKERIENIYNLFMELGTKILGMNPDAKIPSLEHGRGLCTKDGIFSADVVFTAIEDGDRVEALVNMGKKVISVDLNPLSRSAQKADITIVNELTRTMPLLVKAGKSMNEKDAYSILKNYNNEKTIKSSIKKINKRLEEISY
jgi:4-phosphopantoate--beta-alanine ligase